MASSLARVDSEDSFLWEREYADLKIIPSTERESPSKALLLFSELLNLESFKRVLDSGCGNGRNAIYLARKGCEVFGVDISSTAVSKAREKVESLRFSDRVHIHKESMLNPLPFPPGHFDLVLDSYVFCHFFDSDRDKYRHNIRLLTRSAGYFILSVFPPEDGYYGPMLKVSPVEPIVRDPSNDIAKRLYIERELEEFFSPDFRVVYATTLRFEDVVRTKTYVRRVLTVVFCRQ